MAYKLRYSEFSHRINVDAFEEAIGFTPFAQDRGNDIGHCIFPENHAHGDTTGKFAIEREERLWNCFVCGGGDLLSLAMLVLDKDVEEATEWLYQFATSQDSQTDNEFADELLAMLEDVEERVSTMPYFNERVLEKFDDETDYFLNRGISQEVVDLYGLRYTKTAMKVAPIKTARDGSKIKTEEDYYGPASIWPHYWQGNLVGWQYRWSEWDKERTRTPRWLPKWTNTSDFPKATTLFNYNYCLKADSPVAVVESLGTVLFLRSLEIPAVAYFGSQPTDAQCRLMRRFSGVILCPDNDANMAGDKVLGLVSKLDPFIDVYLAAKVRPQEVGLPDDADGVDLGDFAKVEGGEDKVKEHLANATEAGLDL